MPIFEVFSQQDPGGPFIHAGSVEAPDAALALQYARNSFSRREDAFRLWVVPRTAIHEEVDLDLLRPPGDHRYRLGRYYRANVEKRRRLKARVADAAGAEADA
ncbi:MAG TPA: phenylacetic acid degradation protein PaaB [Dehalococcoidia bacterium]|nr:phenylacetic acid degradation protein PaaB [Dehalococcoidia bacterium]